MTPYRYRSAPGTASACDHLKLADFGEESKFPTLAVLMLGRQERPAPRAWIVLHADELEVIGASALRCAAELRRRQEQAPANGAATPAGADSIKAWRATRSRRE